jgi:hypothetical protein
MTMYGSYSDADLDHWQSLPINSHVLTQSAFGAWLLRRDVNKAKRFPRVSLTKVKQAREEIENWSTYDGIYIDRADVLSVLDKLIEEVEDAK